MKLKDIIANVNREESDWVDIEVLCDAANIQTWDFDIDYQRVNNEMSSHYFESWICTDTDVGRKVIFLNNEPICITIQMYRKSDEIVYWLSKEAVGKFIDFINSMSKEDVQYNYLPDEWLEEDEGETYIIEYNEAVIHKTAICLNTQQEVKIVSTKIDSTNIDEKYHFVEVKYPDGHKELKDLRSDIGFKFNVKES